MIEKFLQRSDLYYEVPVYSIAYSSDPTGGEPSVERLINSDSAFWKTIAHSSGQPRKKKLVFTNWRTGWESSQFFLRDFIDKGFELYIYQNNRVKRLLKGKLERYNKKPKGEPPQKPDVSVEEVIQAMAKQGFSASADSIFLLDYFLINQLQFTDSQEPISIVILNDFKNKSSEFYTQVLNSIQTPRVGLRIEYKLDQLTTGYLKLFLEKFKGKIVYFSNLNKESHSLSNLLNYCPHLEILDLSNCKKINEINSDKGFILSDLKQLDLSCSSITSDCLSNLLNCCPNLEGVKLHCCYYINTSLCLADGLYLTKLKELDLRESSITSDSLSKLLNCCPNLEKLNLIFYGINIWEGLCLADGSCLIKLKELALGQSSTNSNSFKKLLGLCPNLERLYLSYYTLEIGSGLVDDELCLSKLKKLTTSHSYISGSSLSKLPSLCPNLEELTLGGNIEGTLCFADCLCLSNLKELILEVVSINSDSVRKLLNCCPNLEKLKLNYDNNTSLCLADRLYLSRLKELKLSHSISSDSLSTLLNCCPNIEKLDLCACQNIKTISFLADRLYLSRLKKLNLRVSSITSDSLSTLLNCCPNLEMLNLNGCENIQTNLCLADLCLTKLKELDLGKSSITSDSLSTLLNCCPNLEMLDLNGCKNIQTNLCLADLCLTKLKELNLESSSMTSDSLTKLLICCPNLEILTIDGKKEIYLTDKIILNHLKELMCRSMTSDSLGELLNCCPNLKLLTLNSCRYVNPIELRYLTNLILLHSQINLSVFLYCYPNLKGLRIHNCTNFNGTLKYELLLGDIDKIPRLELLCKLLSSDQDTTDSFPQTKAGKALTLLETNSYQLDSITKSPKKPLNARQYFLPKRGNDLYPGKYRLDVLTQIDVTQLILFKGPKNLKERNDFRMISIETLYAEYYQTYQNKSEVFLGQITLLMIPDKEYALPSLSANEKIEALSFTPVNVPVTVLYSQEENLYYVTLNKSEQQQQEVTIVYLLQVQEVKVPELPKEVNELIISYNSFDKTGEELAGITLESSRTDILQAMKVQKKGTCRHLTVGFIADLANLPQHLQSTLKVRAIFNDCHAYVEISYNLTSYFEVDLGGSFAQLNITPFIPLKEIIYDRTQQQELPILVEKQQAPAPQVAQSTHLAITRELAKQENYSNRIAAISFSPKIVPPATMNSFADYCPWLLNASMAYSPTTPKALILFNQQSELIEFNLSLIRHLASHKKQFYFIDSLEDIYLKDLPLEKNPALGQEVTIDSDLVRHIKEAQAGDVLIINWSDYESHHIGYNTLLDKERKLYNWPLAEGVIILNVLSTSKTKCMREDFYSRAGIRTTLPSWVPEKQEVIPASCSNVYSVDLYHHQQWQRFLLGYFIPQGEQFVFHKGALLEALEKGYKGLLINNAPTSGPLQLFCEGIEQTRSFTVHGKTYQLPDNFTLLFDAKKHDFADCCTLIPFAPNIAFDYPLHSETLSYAFTTYTCQESKLYEQSGWLKQDQQQTIRLLVTENLPEGEWVRLLDYAKHCECHLSIILTPGILPPTFLNTKLASIASDLPLIPVTKLQDDKVAVILSQDGDLTAAKLAQDDLAAVVLPLARSTTYAEVVEGVALDNSKPIDISALLFKSREGKLLSELKAKKTVIVKGNLSQALMARLSTLFSTKPFLWVNGSEAELTDMGRLFIVTEDPQAFSFVARYQDPDKDCWPLLAARFGHEQISQLRFKINTENKTYSYSQLCAMLEQLQHFPNKNIFKPFQRLDQLLPVKEKTNKNLNNVERRLQKIFRYLKYSPYVFIAGPSGVGKSAFVKNELTKHSHLFVGADHIPEWAVKQANDRVVTLFVDEANLEKEDCFEVFEGLFANPPHIIYKQNYYPLTAKHKVVFAGNYNYFEGRQQHTFFRKHGAVISFKPYSDDELKAIMQPILMKLMNDLSEPALQAVMTIFLTAYHRVNTKSKKPSLTVRNLQMSCLRLALYRAKNQGKALEVLAREALYDDLAQSQLDSQFLNELSTAPSIEENITLNNFIVTTSRKNTLRLFEEHLAIRDLKLTCNLQAGVSGLLLEGPSGIGKSDMVIEYLRAKGFQDGYTADPIRSTTQRYYRLTPTHLAEMERVILKAYHEGAVVIIDELNTLPLEKILNSLLSEGIDSNGKKGFFVVATQNPTSFEGRQILSNAFLNRFHKVILPSYPRKELIEILMRKGLKAETAKVLVDKFKKDVQEAKEHHQIPPTPGELFKVANEFVDEHDRHEQPYKSTESSQRVVIKKDIQEVKEPDQISPTSRRTLSKQPFRLPERSRDVVSKGLLSFYKELAAYKGQRTNEHNNSSKSYKTFWGRIGGYPCQVKISATDKMLSLLKGNEVSFEPRELKALRNARLGKIIHKYKECLPPRFWKQKHLFTMETLITKGGRNCYVP
jgi:MoxR-like ATPase